MHNIPIKLANTYVFGCYFLLIKTETEKNIATIVIGIGK